MDRTDFAVAGLESAPPITVGGTSSLSLVLPGSDRPDLGMSPRTVAAIFGVLLVLHTGVVLRMQQQERAPHLRKTSQVEIQMTRPPPPPPKPVVIPPQEQHPVIPKVVNVARRIDAPPPVHGPPVAEPGESAPAAPEPDPGPIGAPSGDAIAAPVVAAPPPPPPPAPVIQAKEGANYLKNPRPAYPRIAQRENWEGSVLLRVRVLPNGKSANVTVQKSCGHKVLDDAAIETVGGWTFVPATQGGNPIEGWVTVPIEFRLQ